MCINVQASDGGSTTASTSGAVAPRKSVDTFPTSGVPILSNGQMGLGGSLSPVPPTNSGTAPPAPSPAPAALPPPSLPPPYSTAPLQVRESPLQNFAYQFLQTRKNSSCSYCAVDNIVCYKFPPMLKLHHAVSMVRASLNKSSS